MSRMEMQWCVGSYEGDFANKIVAQADMGIGYFVLEQSGKNAGKKCTVAFRRAMDSPLPTHLNVVLDERKIRAYDQMYRSRHGMAEPEVIVSAMGIRT